MEAYLAMFTPVQLYCHQAVSETKLVPNACATLQYNEDQKEMIITCKQL